MIHPIRAREALGAGIALAAMVGPALASEERADAAPQSEEATCTAVFYDRQGGAEIGRRRDIAPSLTGPLDAVDSCLRQAAQDPLPRALAISCTCE